jgi:hypothetical protein
MWVRNEKERKQSFGLWCSHDNTGEVRKVEQMEWKMAM